MIHRRDFIIALGATGLVSACQSGPPKPSTVTVNLAGQAGMNPGPGGGDRPVTVLILRLKSAGKFNSADYFALQGDAGTALAGDLVGSDSVAVGPGADRFEDHHRRAGSHDIGLRCADPRTRRADAGERPSPSRRVRQSPST